MSKKIKKRIPLSDPIYNNALVAKFINHLTKRGKKSIAQRIFYNAFDRIREQLKTEPLDVFNEALKNAGPMLEVRPTRVGGATYQVPREVKKDRRIALSIRWIIGAAKSKKGKPMAEKLAEEIMLAAKNEGEAVKKKINVHKMAEVNRAFAHFSR